MFKVLRTIALALMLATWMVFLHAVIAPRTLRADSSTCTSGGCTCRASNTSCQCNAWYGDCGASCSGGSYSVCQGRPYTE